MKGPSIVDQSNLIAVLLIKYLFREAAGHIPRSNIPRNNFSEKENAISELPAWMKKGFKKSEYNLY